MPSHLLQRHPTLAPEVEQFASAVLATTRTAGAAVAFDADGTLWRGDVGEELLRYQMHHDLLPGFVGRRDLFAEYERLVAKEPARAYAFCVEVMAGVEESALVQLSDELAASRFSGRIHAYARTLIRAFQAAGVDVWVVSASPKWPVVAAAAHLGIPAERVIAVGCGVHDGRLDGRVELPLPSGAGKVAQLERRGIRPVLALGNGSIDVDMLRYAERAVAVAPHGVHTELVEVARSAGWPLQRC